MVKWQDVQDDAKICLWGLMYEGTAEHTKFKYVTREAVNNNCWQEQQEESQQNWEKQGNV